MIRRSMLFLPGNTPSILQNGDDLGADSLILDLEDAVSPTEKDAARILVGGALSQALYRKCEVIVRINPLSTDFWEEDLRAVVPHGPDAIMPTKVSGPDCIRRISAAIEALEREHGLEQGRIRIIPLLETAMAIENAFAIAGADPRMAALYLGAEDLTADFRCRRSKEGAEIFYSRSRLLCAARAAGLDAYDTPFTDVEDIEGLRADAALAKSLGFSGKAVINPRHIPVVNEIFSPSREEIAYAQEVFWAIEEAKRQGKGAISLNGKMIDAPIVERARQVLEAAKEIFGGEEYA